MRFLIGWICMLSTIFAPECFAMTRTSEEKPLVVILMGPPGAGKGTHAAPLSQHLGVPHISSGDLFRENMSKQTYLGEQAKGFINQGKLVPDEIVLNMLFSRIEQPDCRKGYILDGFPRTTAQARALDLRLTEMQYEIVVINLDVPDAMLMERITGRMVCKNCGAPYHKKYNTPAIAGICDGCHGTLYQRSDDQEAILRQRLEVYRAETRPLIEYYGRKLREVNGQEMKELVFQNVLEAAMGARSLSH